jgi:hypothetical protein
VKRFLRRVAPPTPRATLRLEVDPGDEAQVGFGFGGLYRDPESDRVRRAWAFVMTLSCSRHQYAELAFDQSLATWLRLHRAAFEFFRRRAPSHRARQSPCRDRPRCALPLEAVVGDIVRFPPYAGFALTLPVTLVWTWPSASRLETASHQGFALPAHVREALAVNPRAIGV